MSLRRREPLVLPPVSPVSSESPQTNRPRRRGKSPDPPDPPSPFCAGSGGAEMGRTSPGRGAGGGGQAALGRSGFPRCLQQMLGSGCQARRLSQLNHQHQGGGFCWVFFFLSGGVVFFLFLIYDFRLLRQQASSRITLRRHPRAATEARAQGVCVCGGGSQILADKTRLAGGFIHRAAVASIFGDRGGINPPLLRSDSAFPLLTSSSFRLIHDAAAGFHLPPSCCLRNTGGKRHQPPGPGGTIQPGPPRPAPPPRGFP